jgi:surfeit locus 1 family protein
MCAVYRISAQHREDYSSTVGIGDWVFRFRWMPTLLLALPIPLFVALGLWQLDRADQKRDLAAALAERAAQPTYRIQGLVADGEGLRYRRIEATGIFDAEGQFLVEGRREGGKIGFHVITPMRMADSGAQLLVNRGWIPADPRGEPTPAPVPEGSLTLYGQAEVPSPPALALHRGEDAAKEWGGRWPYLTLELFAATVDDPVQPLVMLLDPESPAGFVRHWTRPVPNVWMHQGYAAQWFAFALIALVLYLRLSFERTSRLEDGR